MFLSFRMEKKLHGPITLMAVKSLLCVLHDSIMH